MDNQTATML
jgi:calmodulin